MKKIISSGLISGLCIILCLGVLVGIGRGINSQPSTSSSFNEVISRGIQVEKISETANEYGEKDQVFQYSIEPSKATNHSVEVSLTYSDGSDCSEVMDYSLDLKAKQVTLSCKSDFSKQIKVVLTSLSNKNAKATILMDYLKKVKSLGLTQNLAVVNDYDDWNCTIETYNRITDFNVYVYKNLDSKMISKEYSAYTKDVTYRFKFDISSYDIQENKSSLSENFANALGSKMLEKMLKANTLAYKALTTSEIYACATTDEDKAALKTVTKEAVDHNTSYIRFQIIGKLSDFSNNSNVPSYTISSVSTTLTYFLYGNYA